MASHIFLYLCLVGAALVRLSAGLPPFVKPCRLSDSALDACVSRQTEAAIPYFASGAPEYGIRPMDPIAVEPVVIKNPGLTIAMDDTVVTGLKKMRLNSAKFNANKDKLTLDLTCNLTINCHYSLNGQILILPIKGEGPAKIKARNVHIVVKLHLDEEKDAAGVTHWNVTKHTFTYKLENVQFKLHNLFGGKNPELAEAASKFLNENWESVASELAPAGVANVFAAAVQIIREFLLREPLDNLVIR